MLIFLLLIINDKRHSYFTQFLRKIKRRKLDKFSEGSNHFCTFFLVMVMWNYEVVCDSFFLAQDIPGKFYFGITGIALVPRYLVAGPKFWEHNSRDISG